MTREGYTCITVPLWLYQRLKEVASANGLSVPSLINLLLKGLESQEPQDRFNPFKPKSRFKKVEEKAGEEPRIFVTPPDEGGFVRFLSVDLKLSPRTVKDHVFVFRQLQKFLKARNKSLKTVTREDIRDFLSQYENPSTYSNTLKGLLRLFRDYLHIPELVAGFRFPKQGLNVVRIPSKKVLQEFFYCLSFRSQVLFLFAATSGLRRGEIFGLKLRNISLDLDPEIGVVFPRQHLSTGLAGAKYNWISCFNQEARKYFVEYLETKNPSHNPEWEPFKASTFEPILSREWVQASKKIGFRIHLHLLRKWFSDQMALAGIPDRYVDAFQGRLPQTILARHYSDYTPEKLIQIYKQANIRVLS